MKIILLNYPNEGRRLKNMLKVLLEKNLIISANVLNYAKSYYISEGKIKKDEEKLILIKYPEEKESELLPLIKKLHPYKVLSPIKLSPEKIDEKYFY